jgi:hypothetical protein
MKESAKQLMAEPENKQQYAIDMYWKRLQPAGRWFIVAPGLCTQRPDISDIEGRVTDYTRFFI